MRIVIPLFEEFTALDAVGPYEVLTKMPGAQVLFAAAQAGPVRSDTGTLAIVADASLAEIEDADVLVVPGGPGTRRVVHDAAFLDWVRRIHPRTQWTTSVCTGSLVLGAAGLLKDLTATTHWACYDELAAHGAVPTAQRVVEHLDERLITSAGVSSGIDMALRLVELLVDRTAGEAAQLMIEYDPQPPFDSGSLAKASAQVVARVGEYASFRS